jgi:ribose-phosphate pyrophosphokinase
VAERLILPGPASMELGKAISSRLNFPLLAYDFKVFADGETRFRIEEKVAGTTVFIVQSTHPPTDQHLMQLLLLSHHLSQEGAKVHAVIPYLAYARQDKQFMPGEVLSLGVISHLLRSAGVKRITTVDIHSAEGLSLFSIPIYSVSAIPSLAEFVKKSAKASDSVVVAPDFGSSKRSEAFATLIGADYVKLAKTRDRATGEVKVESSSLDVRGKHAIIVDDIISTGGTVVAATEVLKKGGASRVTAVCVHPLMVGDAQEKLRSAGLNDIVGTNTVPSPVSKVDVSSAIASHIGTLSE